MKDRGTQWERTGMKDQIADSETQTRMDSSIKNMPNNTNLYYLSGFVNSM